jgi:hypothetical protein
MTLNSAAPPQAVRGRRHHSELQIAAPRYEVAPIRAFLIGGRGLRRLYRHEPH